MNIDIGNQNQNKIEIALYQIKQLIIEKLEDLGLSEDALFKIKSENIFDIPSDTTHGDYTTNVAMMCAKELKMSPRELAENLTLALSKGEGTQFQIAGPGFINIKLGNEIRIDYLKNIVYIDAVAKKENFYNRDYTPYIKVNSKWSDKKVLIEYTDPNPFKIFHIGHLVQNTAGESASRLLDIGGANLRRLCYQGDVGMHVAKTIWGMRKVRDIYFESYNKKDFNIFINFVNENNINVTKADIDFLQGHLNTDIGDLWYRTQMVLFAIGYVFGSIKFVEAENQMEIKEAALLVNEIKALNKDVYRVVKENEIENIKFDQEPNQQALLEDEIKDEHFDYKNDQNKKDYSDGYVISMQLFESMYNLLGTNFNRGIRESEVSDIAISIIERFKNELFIESDGAIVNDVNVTGMHTRVFVNSQGLPTYEAKDIGNFAYKLSLSKDLFKTKENKNNNIDKNISDVEYAMFDYSVVSTGNEIDEYFKLINKVIGFIYPQYAEKQIHISNGMLKLTTGKMSSRKGSVVPAMEMIEDMEQAILEKSSNRNTDTTNEISSQAKEELNHDLELGKSLNDNMSASERAAIELDVDENEKNKYKYLAINAFKFSFLKQAMGKDVIYDREKAIDVNGDSGMYVNYTYARILSLIKKAKDQNYKTSFYALESKGGMITIIDNEISSNNFSSSAIEDMESLERVIAQYNYIMERAINNLEPHRVAQYALSICHEINKFYNDNKVIDENKSKEEIEYLLCVLDSSRTVLQSILFALGMRTIESV